MAGEDDNEDFSFPTTCSPPRFIGSPRLWRSPSHSLYHVHQIKLTKQQEHEETSDGRKTIHLLSYIKKKDIDGDENMDVIWEDLNYEEEICSLSRRDGNVSCDFNHEMNKCEQRYGEIGVACRGGKRPSVVAFVKVLKKLLLLHHTSRHWNVKK